MEQQLQSLADQLTQLTETIRNDAASVKAHPEQLSRLSEAANAFAKQTRGPAGYISEMMTNIVLLSSLGLFNRWRVFDHIPTGGSISYQALADKLGADTALISRNPRLSCPSQVLFIVRLTYMEIAVKPGYRGT